MGSVNQKSNELIVEGLKTGEWTCRTVFGIQIFTNSFSGEQFELQTLKVCYPGFSEYRIREKYAFPNTPKIICIDEDSPSIQILIQHAPYRIEEFLQGRKSSDIELLVELFGLLETVNSLMKKYGCFFPTDSMFRVTQNQKILIWINENFGNNQVQFPIPNGEGEEALVGKLLKIYGKQLSENYKLQSISNFKEAENTIGGLIEKCRKPMISGSSRISTYSTVPSIRPSVQSVESHCLPVCRQIPPMNDKLALAHSQSISENLASSRMTVTIPYPQGRSQTIQRQLPPAPFKNFLTAPPQRNNPEVYSRSDVHDQFSRYSKNNGFEETFPMTSPALKRIPFQPVANRKTSNFQSVESSASSYESMQYTNKGFLNLKQCETEEDPVFRRIHLIKTESIVPSIDLKVSESMEDPWLDFDRNKCHQSPQRQLQGSENLNHSDLSIRKNINDVENDLMGLFSASARTIQETSELGSPMRREIRSDLQKLF